MLRSMGAVKQPPSIAMNRWAKSPYCKLLLHMNGENNGTVFRDDSPLAKSISPQADAKTSTTKKRIGASAGYFDGTGDYLSISDGTGFNFTTGDVTVSVWVNPASISAYNSIFGPSTGIGKTGLGIRASTGYLSIGVLGVNDYSNTVGISAGVWSHIAVIKSGSTTTFYINGVAAGSTTTSVWTNSSSNVMAIGYDGWDPKFYGYMNDLAIWNGVAIPITDLYPPRAPLYDYAISEWGGQ